MDDVVLSVGVAALVIVFSLLLFSIKRLLSAYVHLCARFALFFELKV